jgi:hypothetical protein
VLWVDLDVLDGAPRSKTRSAGPVRIYKVTDVYKLTYIGDGRWSKMMGFG